MKFKEYVNMRFGYAVEENGGFDPDGNSRLATCKRSFTKEVMFNIKPVLKGYCTVAKDLPILLASAIATTAVLVLFPISFPMFLMYSSVNSKLVARKEVYVAYLSYLEKIKEGEITNE